MVDLAEIGLILQTVSVMSAATAAVIGVRSYLNSNKRAEDAKRKEQETRDRELETRQAQLFMGVYDRFASAEFVDAWYIYVLRNWSTLKEFMELWNEDPDFRRSFGLLTSWMEGLGTLVREGLLPIRLVAILCSGTVRTFWEKMSPFIEDTRVEYKRNLSESEYLYNALIKYLADNPEFQTEGAKFKELNSRAHDNLT